MGWAILLVRNFIFWLDTLSQKSIRQALPDLETLLYDPRTALGGQEVLIGPSRKYATSLVWGLVLSLGVWIGVVIFVVAVINPRNAFPGRQGQVDLLLMIGLVALQVGAIALVLRLVRGGWMILTERGVELRYRGQEVFCPWTLFNTPGQPFTPARDQVVFPVAPRALGLVQARHNGSVVAEGIRVKTRQLWFRSAHEGVLRDLYEVPVEELVKVLLFLGRALGESALGAIRSLDFPLTEGAESEPARLDPDGWVTVSLTRLVLPPQCCACGAATAGRQKFTAVEPFLSLGRLGHPIRRESISIWVPVCYPCQTANKLKFQQAILNGLSLGILLLFLAGLARCLWPANSWLLLVFMVALLFAPLGGGMAGYQAGRQRSLPVRLRDYSARKGTIAIHFRRMEYTEQMLAAIRARVS
jgi:hypothetical protein